MIQGRGGNTTLPQEKPPEIQWNGTTNIPPPFKFYKNFKIFFCFNDCYKKNKLTACSNTRDIHFTLLHCDK